MAGIVGYGASIPRFRIRVEEIAKVWGADVPSYKQGLMLTEKSVAGPDQDTVTFAIESARWALLRAGINAKEIGAVYVGSESHPYAVKPSGTIVAEALGMTPYVHTASLEFACKAGTEALYVTCGLVDAGRIKYGLAIGADTSQGAPGDALEYATASGGAAFIVGKDDILAKLECEAAFMTDTPDFWRRQHEHYPSHGGRFTGDPAYFRHVSGACKALFKQAGLKPADITYAVFHQPNGKFPRRVAEMLGFTEKQIEPGLLSPKMGNAYSGSSPLGLCATLDVAKPGDRIAMVSYGSGAGSDAFLFSVTDRINDVRAMAPAVRDLIGNNVEYLDYATYAKYRGKINMG
jgi:hydroxymethylglutaryl-CoA synthase